LTAGIGGGGGRGGREGERIELESPGEWARGEERREGGREKWRETEREGGM